MKFVPSNKRISAKTNLYMKNFNLEFTKEDCENWIKEKFENKGEITSQGVYSYKKGDDKERYFAFVSFKEEESAKKVLEEL